MRILYITSGKKNEYLNDYLSDLLLHGLREIMGEKIIDYPGSWYLYRDESEKRKINLEKNLWGKGFTSQNILDDYDRIDRSDIQAKIKKKYFDLVIYSSIRRSNMFLEDVIKFNNQFIFVDGEDDEIIDRRYSEKSIYFKRELSKSNIRIFPISFAIPRSKIITEINQKKQYLLAPLIPGKLKTYTYKNEKDYYDMYKKSFFGLTYKKAGWDCLRHYEILMNGSIPFFLNLDKCPILTMTNFPKKQIIYLNEKYKKILSYYNPFKIFKKKYLTPKRIINFYKNYFLRFDFKNYFHNDNEIIEFQNKLLNYTRNNLTTEKLAKYVISQLKV